MPALKLDIKLVDNRIAQLGADLRQAAEDLVEATAENIVATAVDSMSGPKSGRIYMRRGIPHQASAPGEPPARDTGALAGGIAVQPGANPLQRVVAVPAEYGLALEFGTVKMAPRPFLTPAVEQQRPAFEAGVEGLLRKAGK